MIPYKQLFAANTFKDCQTILVEDKPQFLWALIIQRIFSIPTDKLLLTFPHYSKHLKELCCFSKVPDASKITRFKQDFLEDLQSVFDNLVDITEPISQAINSAKADMTIP